MQYVIFFSGQIILSTLCAFLMKTRKVWLFSAHMLPLLARLFAAPHATLLTVNTFSMGLTGAGITVFLLSHLFLPYRLVRAAYSELLQLEVLLFWNTSFSSFYNESCSSEDANVYLKICCGITLLYLLSVIFFVWLSLILYSSTHLCFFCPSGDWAVQTSGCGNLFVEPVCRPSALQCLLVCAVHRPAVLRCHV